jgi:hypothetical protein
MYQKLGINNRTVLAALAISRRQASTFLRVVPKTG